MRRFYEAVGGRKVALGMIAAALLTLMAWPLDASFGGYAGAILTALGITSGSVAYEDARRTSPRETDER